MPKLTRYLQKIFANNSNEVGVFGTGVDKETSKNVETLQSADYENGWSSAIITNKNYPIWQEMDGVQYGLSYQIKYLQQSGIPEWLSTETYYTNNYCRVGSNIYYSLQDDNTNHNPALNDGWWTPLLTSNRSIGEIIPSTIPLTEAGLHLLDGALISSGMYADFVNYIKDLYNSGTASSRFTTEANWQASVASNGLCSQFVYDSVNNTVRLPKWGNIAYTKQYTLTLASTVPVRGNGKTLGFTNGTDLLGLVTGSPNTLQAYTGNYNSNVGTSWSGSNPSVVASTGVTTDGTKSGLVANTSGVAAITNDPLSCYYYIVVATSTKTDIEVDIDEIATDLNGKADVDLTNLTNTGNIKMAHSAMPSDLYEDITVGASAASYQAPADGFYAARAIATGAGAFILLSHDQYAYFAISTGFAYGAGLGINSTIQVAKGDTVYLFYTSANFEAFRFYYAKGSESEAV